MIELSKKDALPTTYLGLQMIALDMATGGRFAAVKPSVVGAEPIPPAPVGSAWSTEVVGNELPYCVDISKVGALGGAGGTIAMGNIADEPLHSTGSEVSPPLGGGEGEGGER